MNYNVYNIEYICVYIYIYTYIYEVTNGLRFSLPKIFVLGT